jgi:hypothetical protein
MATAIATSCERRTCSSPACRRWRTKDRYRRQAGLLQGCVCRRDLRAEHQSLRRLPKGSYPNDRSLFAFDLASKCAKVQTPLIATWVQAERRWRSVGRAAWMPQERRQDMDVRSARAHGALPE